MPSDCHFFFVHHGQSLPGVEVLLPANYCVEVLRTKRARLSVHYFHTHATVALRVPPLLGTYITFSPMFLYGIGRLEYYQGQGNMKQLLAGVASL